MGDYNSENNRAVWFDIPVADLERSAKWYRSVLDIEVHVESMENFEFGVLAHEKGNGGCLIPGENQVSADRGVLLYLNVDGRIQDAVGKVEAAGGNVVEPIHPIGPHGFRAIVHDSEGNRLALHSNTDA
ncbi:MAG: VOC family protein [Planctomycetota bacterium]